MLRNFVDKSHIWEAAASKKTKNSIKIIPNLEGGHNFWLSKIQSCAQISPKILKKKSCLTFKTFVLFDFPHLETVAKSDENN